MLAASIVEYSTGLTAAAHPNQIAVDASGNLWFTEPGANKIGVINSTSHSISEYGIPTSSSGAGGIALGSGQTIFWFTETSTNKIGKINVSSHAFTEYTVPTSNSMPIGITAGPDNNLWFTEENGNKIGTITTAGVITEYPVTTLASQPDGITTGADNNLWFTEKSGNKIGMITTAGAVTEFPISTTASQPVGIVGGPDGNLWFTEQSANKIGMITADGNGIVTEYPIPTTGATPTAIAAGSDGSLWFTESAGSQIGSITTDGVISEVATPTSTSSPSGIAAGPQGNLWFTESTANKIAQIVLPITTSIALTASPTSPSTFGQDVTFTAVVSSQATGTPSGSVTFTIDGQAETPASLAVVATDDEATFTASGLSPGFHTISASYGGDTTFAASASSVLSQVVGQAATTTQLSSSANPGTFGQSVVFTAAVTPSFAGTPTGTVTFTIDGIAKTAVAIGKVGANFQASYSTSSLVVTGHTISATYNGDASFAPSTASALNESIVKASSTTTVSMNPIPAVFGQPVQFTAVVASTTSGSPSGSVVFTIDGIAQSPVSLAVVGGQDRATFSLSSLSSGSHSVTAAYSGDASFTASTSSTLNASNQQATTSTALTASPASSVINQAVTFTAVVSSSSGGAPSGLVTFVIDGQSQTPIAVANVHGQVFATFTTASLSAENHAISASYSGDTSYAASSTAVALTETVSTNPTALELQASPSLAFSGYSIQFTADVSSLLGAGAPSGTVTFSVDGIAQSPVALVAGNAESTAGFVASNLVAGSHVISAVYNGDAAFSTSTSTLNEVVSIDPTTTALSESLNFSNLGQQVTFTAVVAPAGTQIGILGLPSGTPTGTVTFDVDGVPETPIAVQLVGGQKVAVFSTSSLSAGSHLISATYNGDASFAPSTAQPLDESVGSISTTMTVSATANPAAAGQQVTLTAVVNPINSQNAVSDNLTGSATFSIDGQAQSSVALFRQGSSQSNLFAASFLVPTLTVGNHAITVFYPGDGTFGSSSSSLNLQITPAATTTQLTISNAAPALGQLVTFTAIVTPQPSGTATGTVTFWIDGQALTPSQLNTVNGQEIATFSTSSLTTGSHAIVANYSGDSSYSGSTSNSSTLTVNATSVQLSASANISTPGQSVTFTAIVSPLFAGTPTGSVIFSIDGVPQTSVAITVVNGHVQATFATSSLSTGAHTVVAAYSGDSQFAGSISNSLIQNVSLISTITQLSITPFQAVFGQSVQFVAKLSAVSGTPTGSVMFSIDGQATSPVPLVIVNGEPTAIFSPPALSVGNHIVTASYSGVLGFSTSLSSAVDLPIVAASTTLQLSPSVNPAMAGQPISIAANVQTAFGGVPTGLITFTIDGNAQAPLPLSTFGGQSVAIWTSSALSIGSHTISASYGGDGSFNGGNSNSLIESITQVATTIQLTSSGNPTASNHPATFSAVVSSSTGISPTGTVIFHVDGQAQPALSLAIINGQSVAALTTNLLAGSHTITAVYVGTSMLAASSSNLFQQTIVDNTTATLLTTSSASVLANQPVTFTALVTSAVGGLPSGNVALLVDGQVQQQSTLSVINGQEIATFTTILTPGNHSVTANYSGDSSFPASGSNTVGEAVSKLASTTTISSSNPSASVGEPLRFSVSVSSTSGNPSGSVGLVIDGVTQAQTNLAVVAGQSIASFSVPNLSAGNHVVSVDYAGDSSFLASNSSTLPESIAKLSTVTVIQTSNVAATLDNVVTFTATVSSSSAGTPTGTVVFMIDGQPQTPIAVSVVNGLTQASLSSAALSAGSHTISSQYRGDSSFESSQSTTLSQAIAKASTITNLTASAASAQIGQTLTFSAIITNGNSGTPTGTVTFIVDGQPQSTSAVSLLNGQDLAQFSTSSLAAGTHSVTAIYSGDVSYLGSASNTLSPSIFQVSTSTQVIASTSTTKPGKLVTFTAIVKSATPGGSVHFAIDGQPQTSVALSTVKGVLEATFTTKALKSGSHTISATYDGSVTYASSTATTSVFVTGKIKLPPLKSKKPPKVVPKPKPVKVVHPKPAAKLRHK